MSSNSPLRRTKTHNLPWRSGYGHALKLAQGQLSRPDQHILQALQPSVSSLAGSCFR